MTSGCERLAERGIGLWDVIASAQPAAAASTRRSATPSTIAIEQLLRRFPGAAGGRVQWRDRGGGRAQAARRPPRGSTLIDLPSSSAANTRPFADKAAAWSVLAQFVGLSLAPARQNGHDGDDDPTDDDEADSDKRLSMVDEALVAGTIANTNGLLVILAKLVAKGVFDRDDLQGLFRQLFQAARPCRHARERAGQPDAGPDGIDAGRADALPQRARQGRLIDRRLTPYHGTDAS